MKNIIDSANVIGLRRLGFYQITGEKLKDQNIDYDKTKLRKIIESMDNMLFLTQQEKQLKKINPNISANIISRDNPSLLNTIIKSLQN